MKVFISWSGERSESLAKALRKWFPLVLHYVDPWLSQSDIQAGERWSIEIAKLAREHNNANVISIGGRMHSEEFCLQLVDAFLSTPFPGDERHIRRINLIAEYEKNGSL